MQTELDEEDVAAQENSLDVLNSGQGKVGRRQGVIGDKAKEEEDEHSEEQAEEVQESDLKSLKQKCHHEDHY